MLRPGEIEITQHAPEPGCSPEVARQYTRWLATHHYENFNVVSWLLPKALLWAPQIPAVPLAASGCPFPFLPVGANHAPWSRRPPGRRTS